MMVLMAMMVKGKDGDDGKRPLLRVRFPSLTSGDAGEVDAINFIL